MSRWAGLFLVLGAVAGCTLFGHRASSSAPEGGNSPEMLGQRSNTSGTPAYADTSNNGRAAAWSSPAVVAPPNAGPAGDPPSVEPARTVSTQPTAPAASSASLDVLTAPLPQPHYMTQSLQAAQPSGAVSATITGAAAAPAMSTPAPAPMPMHQLPDTLPPMPDRAAPAPATATPFGTTPPVPRPVTTQAPTAWPPPPGQAVPLTAAVPTPASLPAQPDRGTVLLTSSTTNMSATPQARLVGGIDAIPNRPSPTNTQPATTATTEARKPVTPDLHEGFRSINHVDPAIEDAPTTAAGIRLLNSKRFSLAYAVKDLGPSGLAGVELWYTQDGKTWQKHPSPLHHHSPYVIEVGDEDLYGFTLVAHSGSGVSTQVPKPGDLPQVWVEVDVTSPVVRLLGVEPGTGTKAGTVTILWSATDKHLGSTPISIAYAERPEGPWQPIADKIANDGCYVWKLTPGLPMQFYVRVQAVDEARNVGEAQTPQPIVGDLARPSISILGVAPAARK